jgi:hypothetical protein
MAKLHKGTTKDTTDQKSTGEGDEDVKTAQKGASKTDTEHSEDPNADSSKSSKGEGTAEKENVKGTA